MVPQVIQASHTLLRPPPFPPREPATKMPMTLSFPTSLILAKSEERRELRSCLSPFRLPVVCCTLGLPLLQHASPFNDLPLILIPFYRGRQIMPTVQYQKPPFFATAPFSHTTTHSAFIAGCEVLTVRRVRHITSSLSWCPASADHGQGAKLPESPTIWPYQGKRAR